MAGTAPAFPPASITRALLEGGPWAVMLLQGPTFTVGYASAACQALLPWRSLLGRPLAEAWPEAAAALGPALAGARADGRLRTLDDLRIDRGRPGTEAAEPGWFCATLQPVPAGDGAPPDVAIHLADRTGPALERARARELEGERGRLLDAERAARSAEQLAEAIPQIVWTSDPEGRPEWFNRRWQEYTGLDVATSRREGLRAALHDQDVPRVLNRWLTGLRARSAVEVEARLRAADGTYRWHLLRAVPLRDERGAISRWFASASDVEEQLRARSASEVARRREEGARRRAEEAGFAAVLRAGEFAAVLDSIADGLVVTNRESAVERTNETARRLLGPLLPGADWLQRYRPLDEGGREVAPDQLAPARALLGEVVRGQELRLELRAEPSPPIWISVSAAPVREEGGTILGVVTTFTDITRLRSLQERQADLLRAISHDLRTPLTVIMTQAQLLQRRPDDPPTVLRRAASLRTSAQRMAAMIDDLVDLVRLEAGLVKLHQRSIALGPFTAELRERLRGTLPMERLRLEISDALPAVAADPPRLERILVNLITNAFKYSPPESEAVLRVERVEAGLRLTVSDQGPGIPPDEAPRVFERFWRSPSATRTEGLGLGLYITRLLVEAHGGQIAIESEVGRGSAFHVTLPLSPDPAR